MKRLLVLLFALPLSPQDNEPVVSMDEKILGSIPDGMELKLPIVFRKDGKGVAFAVTNHGRELVVEGKERGREYDEVRGITFSPDCETLAYFAREGDQWFAIIGDKKGPPFANMGVTPPVFHPGGKWAAYAAAVRKGNQTKWTAVANGQPGELFDSVDQIMFSASGKTLLHRASDSLNFIVANGQKGRRYNTVGTPIFAPKGETFSYVASQDFKSFMVTAGGKPKDYDWIGAPRYLADGKTLAYPAKEKDTIFPVLGDQRGQEFPCGTKWPASGMVSSDGKRLAYQGAKDISTDPQKPKWVNYVVVDGKKGDEYDQVNSLMFSPDGKVYAHGASVDRKTFVIFDGKKTETPDAVVGPLHFTPDCAALCYVTVSKDGKYAMNVGAKKSAEFEYIATRAYFSEDGKKAAFGVRAGKELMWKVFDFTAPPPPPPKK